MRDFEGGIRSEIEHLQKIASRQSRNRDDDVRKTAATIRSSNLSSYELLWATAKRSRGVVAFRQWYRLEPSVVVRRNESKQTKRALVDIVAEDGEEWVKVSSVNEKRLLFDVAKEGWGRFGEDRSDFGSEGEEEDMGPHANGISRAHREDDVPDIPLLKSARDLAAAARANRVRGRIPKVRVVLPRVKRGESSEVDLLLAKLEASGCGLALADDIHEANPDLSAVLDRMSVDPEARLSTTLNIDCTILTSLISDISHVAHLKPEPWYNAMLREQLRFEREETLLPSTLYPVLRGRRLVTTERAAEQCRVIVDTIGNEGEKVRCDALLGRRPASEARDTLKKLSDHDVPAGVQVPIEVVRDSEVPEGTTPRSALSPSLVKQVCGGLSEINRSVFGFGWKTGWTTITSNNNTVRELEVSLFLAFSYLRFFACS